MAKILSIVGSYRKNGNTARVLNLLHEDILNKAERENISVEIETVFLGEFNLNPCRGCRCCFDRGEDTCPLGDDDLNTLFKKMHAADGLIIATPVYVNDVSGLVKTWMDRLAFACHRPQFHGKSALVVSTVGTGIHGYTQDVLAAGITSWGYHLSGKLGITGGALTPQADLAARYQKPIHRAAEKLVTDIQKENHLRPSLRSLVTFAVQQAVWQRHQDEDTVDARYWHEQGWTKPSTRFYLPPRTQPIVILLTRAIGRAIARFIA
ncbi:flavodoxin family protein [Ornatilinea apprima]|uniref:flavodoxin family protein n=1 Tax=Ornatilinea apprima TaxID=1134406 RepID=UPI0009464E87|nr:flavodoxin family protein [Ornatilinea apprima]